MTMTPFTPEGVSAKMTELYRLDEADLLLEARSVGIDFKSWFRNHFLLETSQLKYLEEASSSFLLFWGYVFGTAFIGRRPITMIKLPKIPGNETKLNERPSVRASYYPDNTVYPSEITFQGEVKIIFMEE
jgi:hypothetical protein